MTWIDKPLAVLAIAGISWGGPEIRLPTFPRTGGPKFEREGPSIEVVLDSKGRLRIDGEAVTLSEFQARVMWKRELHERGRAVFRLRGSGKNLTDLIARLRIDRNASWLHVNWILGSLETFGYYKIEFVGRTRPADTSEKTEEGAAAVGSYLLNYGGGHPYVYATIGIRPSGDAGKRVEKDGVAARSDLVYYVDEHEFKKFEAFVKQARHALGLHESRPTLHLTVDDAVPWRVVLLLLVDLQRAESSVVRLGRIRSKGHRRTTPLAQAGLKNRERSAAGLLLHACVDKFVSTERRPGR